jgi:hypothetical protein
MPDMTTSLLERLREVALREPGGLIATDADGTLWQGDVGEDLFAALLDRDGIRDEAHAALVAEAEAFALPSHGGPHAVARALHAASHAGAYPLDRSFAMMAWAFAGWPIEEVEALAREVVVTSGLASRLRPELRAILGFARETGVDVLVVSASPVAMVTAGAALFDVAPSQVLAMRPIVQAGRLGAAIDGRVVYGEGKLAAIRDARSDAPILAAFGDSAFDAAMLRAAKLPVLVYPSRPLVDLLPTIPGALVIPEV